MFQEFLAKLSTLVLSWYSDAWDEWHVYNFHHVGEANFVSKLDLFQKLSMIELFINKNQLINESNSSQSLETIRSQKPSMCSKVIMGGLIAVVSVSAPFTTLVSPSQSFVWSDAFQNEFDSIKRFPIWVNYFRYPTLFVQAPFHCRMILQVLSIQFAIFLRNLITIRCNAPPLKMKPSIEVYVGSGSQPICVYTDHKP